MIQDRVIQNMTFSYQSCCYQSFHNKKHSADITVQTINRTFARDVRVKVFQYESVFFHTKPTAHLNYTIDRVMLTMTKSTS